MAGSLQRRFKQRRVNETDATPGQGEGTSFVPKPHGTSSTHQTTLHSGSAKGNLSDSLLRKVYGFSKLLIIISKVYFSRSAATHLYMLLVPTAT